MTSEEPPPIALFEGVSCVIHCGGVAHRRAAEAEYQHINVAATLRLAEAAAIAGVSHFIFLSSMNVVPADAGSPDALAAMWSKPRDPYTASKWSAERELTQLLKCTECELTIVRPGLVYDVELTANLARLKSFNALPHNITCIRLQDNGKSLGSGAIACRIVSGRCGVMQGGHLVAGDGERYDAADLSGTNGVVCGYRCRRHVTNSGLHCGLAGRSVRRCHVAGSVGPPLVRSCADHSGLGA